jgi:hypothetical protein
MLSSKNCYRISLLFALGVIGFFAFALSLPPVPACGGLDPKYPLILAFEMARSVADLHAIFGDTASTCRDAVVAQVDRVDWADSFFFIPIYTAFIVFFFLGARARDARLGWIGVILALVALGGDYTENSQLFQLSADPDHASMALAMLPWATAVKWIALALAGGVAGLIFVKAGGIYYVLAAACFIGLVVTVAAIANPHALGSQLSNAISLSWISFLIVDLLESFPARLAVAQLEEENRP